MAQARCTGDRKTRIHLSSVRVDDQDRALRFCTEVPGFVKKHEVPLGEHRWPTVVSPEGPEGTELVLEPARRGVPPERERAREAPAPSAWPRSGACGGPGGSAEGGDTGHRAADDQRVDLAGAFVGEDRLEVVGVT
ncbi:VOC family protein [Streptomyces sp. NPDC001443]